LEQVEISESVRVLLNVLTLISGTAADIAGTSSRQLARRRETLDR
jgi:hypothetical protein